MFLMEKALDFWRSEYEIQGSVDWNTFPYIVQERLKLFRAYHSLNEPCWREGNKSNPLWTQNSLTTMTKLVTFNGFVMYSELCKELRVKIVDSFIEHNIIHLHPTRRCTFDLPAVFYDKPDDEPIITAKSACGLYAMKKLLRKINVDLGHS